MRALGVVATQIAGVGQIESTFLDDYCLRRTGKRAGSMLPARFPVLVERHARA